MPWPPPMHIVATAYLAPSRFSTEAAALTLLYGLVAFGQIQLRKIDGYTTLPSFLEQEWQKVA